VNIHKGVLNLCFRLTEELSSISVTILRRRLARVDFCEFTIELQQEGHSRQGTSVSRGAGIGLVGNKVFSVSNESDERQGGP
jgi:hypothetical protein